MKSVKSATKKKSTTKKTAPRDSYILQAGKGVEISFKLPKGLVRRGKFLIWSNHPWLGPNGMPSLYKGKSLQEEAKKAIAEKVRPHIQARARELASQPSRPLHARGESLARRTRGWKVVFPATTRQRAVLAAIAPEAFMVYELKTLKKLGPGEWIAQPKFPVVPRLPKRLEDIVLKGWPVSDSDFDKYVVIDVRGLNAAYNRARQHYAKYGPGLTTLIERLQKRARM